MKSLSRLASLVLLFAAASPLLAELHVANVFASNMVLQRGVPMPIWGTATPEETITVQFAGQTARTSADQNGAWSVTLKPLKGTPQGQTLQIDGESDSKIFKYVLVGEVWHACGQSNMAITIFQLSNTFPETKPKAANSDYQQIRYCRLFDAPEKQPLEDLNSPMPWLVGSGYDFFNFSAVAFHFARELQEELNIPIGIIDSSHGGTPIEAYIPREAFTSHPTLVRERELGDREDLEALRKMPGGTFARNEYWLPGRLYNARVAPVRRLPARGVIWYQGESNCGTKEDPHDYAVKMRALISGWRNAMSDEDLPFYCVQLPGSGARDGWPYLREQQRLASDVPYTGMVVTLDIQGPTIHPPNKVDVGQRLARWALAKQYDKPVHYSGPMFDRQVIDGDRIVVHFQHADSGLMLAQKQGLDPPQETPDAKLTHFEIADAHGNWHPAEATIDGQTVVVTSAKVGKPIAVRYAYAVSPEDVPLYNRDGLPASPFCSEPKLLKYDPQLQQ